MSFSAELFAYCPRPNFSSQSATCCIEAAPLIVRLHRPRWQLYPRSSKRSRRHVPRGKTLESYPRSAPRGVQVSGGFASLVLCGTMGWVGRGPRGSCRVLSSAPVLGWRGLRLSHVSVSCSEPARSATCRLGRQPSRPALRPPAIATHPHADRPTRLHHRCTRRGGGHDVALISRGNVEGEDKIARATMRRSCRPR
jgi:hypothetical protein